MHSLSKIKHQRTASSIYYLLTGKQSIQTIQDANLFQLEPYFSLYKNLSFHEFDTIIYSLRQEHFIEQHNEQIYQLTSKGERSLADAKISNYSWHGLNFGQIDDTFIQRLFLLIQVWTNRRAHIKRYIPIIDRIEITSWVKSFYYKKGNTVDLHLQSLYEELVDLFSKLDSICPEMFIKQMTTDTVIGLTDEQLAVHFNVSLSDVYLIQKHYIHFMLQSIQAKNRRYPLLYRVANDLFTQDKKQTVTKSAQRTAKLLYEGLGPGEIALKRRLRKTTIYDHIVEIALQDEHFPYERFVTKKIEQEIHRAVRQLNSFKLKDIKGIVDPTITYFQIRLVLTKLNRMSTDGVMT